MAEKYLCIRKCYFRHRIFNVGDPAHFEAGENIPRHFEPASSVKPAASVPAEDPKTIVKGLRAPLNPEPNIKPRRRAARPPDGPPKQ